MADRLTYTVPEAAHALGVGKNRVYDLIAAGDLIAVKFGRVIRIPKTSLETWLESKLEQPWKR